MQSDAERHRLRATFDEVPDLYDRARAPYPGGLFDDLIRLADLSAGDRLLEIGCGNGRATLPLAERGLEIVCIELGPRLAALARGLRQCSARHRRLRDLGADRRALRRRRRLHRLPLDRPGRPLREARAPASRRWSACRRRDAERAPGGR